MNATKRKATGSHFTPPNLASLVAERLLTMMNGMKGPLRILDPACGDGNLLFAIAKEMPESIRRRTTLIGIEQDDDAFLALRSRDADSMHCKTDLIRDDFLELFGDDGLFGSAQASRP